MRKGFKEKLHHVYFNEKDYNKMFRLAKHYLFFHWKENEDLAFAKLMIGQIYLHEDNLIKAKPYLLSAEELYTKLNLQDYTLSLVYGALGRLFFDTDDYMMAIKYNELFIQYIEEKYKGQQMNFLLDSYHINIKLCFFVKNYNKLVKSYTRWLELYVDKYKRKDKAYHEVEQSKVRVEQALTEKSKGFPNPLFEVSFENGQTSLMDSIYANWLVSELPEASQKSIDILLGKVDRIEVIQLFDKIDGQPQFIGRNQFLNITDSDYLKKIRESIVMEYNIEFQMLVYPVYLFILFENNQKLGEIHYLGKNTIRVSSIWKEDILLKDDTFAEFIREIGINPKEAFYIAHPESPHSHLYYQHKYLGDGK